MRRNYQFWSRTDISEFRAALKDAIAAGADTLDGACRKVAPWHGREYDALSNKSRRLGWTYESLIGADETPALTPLQNDVLRLIREKQVTTFGELSRQVDRSKETVKRTVAELFELGYEIDVGEDTKQVSLVPEAHKKLEPIDLDVLRGDTLRFGVLGDTHFGSRQQCLSLVNLAYEVFDRAGCQFALHGGDITDGKNVYKGQEADLFLHTADEQADYVVENYPKWDRKTYVISGNHDLSFKKLVGLNIVRSICSRRDDMIYRGDEIGTFHIDNNPIKIMHPWGGRSYSISYNPQKISDGMLRKAAARRRNNLDAELAIAQFIGHYHVWGAFEWGGTDTILVPCLQQSVPHYEVRGSTCNIGCLVVELTVGEGKATRIIPERYNWDHLTREKDW